MTCTEAPALHTRSTGDPMTVTRPRRWWWRTDCVQRVSLMVALALLMVSPSPAADISYVYDDAGRLRAVIDPATNTAIYAYL